MRRAIFLFIPLLLILAACSSNPPNTPVAQKSPPTPTAAIAPATRAPAPTAAKVVPGKKCGDGTCGGPENAQNCPADCAAGQPTAPSPTTPPPTATIPPEKSAPAPANATDFTPAPVPELNTVSDGAQPFYFFLFTHTEDQFNHELSEERYTRFVPQVESLAASHPDAHLVWTIMFQGSDAKTVADRNPQTGVLDLLRAANDAGVVEFGFHEHHDATYMNRPQMSFTDSTPWEELVSGMIDWLGCEKDPVRGGCVAPTGGGLYAVQNNFGDVQAASGIFMQSEVGYQGGPTTHAALSIRPDLLLGYGYPDHGAFVEKGHREVAGELMARLAPAADTSGSVFWADNFIKMNGGNPIDGPSGIDPIKGPQFVDAMLGGFDRSRPNVILTGLASKFLYTKSGTSPTKYGYSHADSPELPPEWLNSTQQKEQKYQMSSDALNHLLDDVLPQNPGSRFVNSAAVISMVAPPEYWVISPEKLDVLARWALLNWTDRPPDWVSDGADFYSLRDLFGLLVLSLGDGDSAGGEVSLPTAYGPLQPVDATKEVQLSRDELLALAAQLAPNFAPGQPWQTTPQAMVQPTYATSAGDISAAQLLYGLATVYAADFAGTPVSGVRLPATRAMPVTYDLLLEIGCLNTCSGTAWSFKPARLRPPSDAPRAETAPAPAPAPAATPTPAPAPVTVSPAPSASDAEAYTLFSINVQDFSYPSESAAVVNKIIDLHEETGVPVDIYLTADMAQIYADQFPDLLERLKTSPVVAVSYHFRPPRPYANGYDWLGMKNMSATELHDTILRYETHAVNPETGETTDAPGGYQQVAALMGYPPYAASAVTGNPAIASALVQVHRELGAQMTVTHGKTLNLGDMNNGLPVRPDHADYRVFEEVGQDAGTAFEAALAQAKAAAGASPAFVGVKIHDNNFFATQSAWLTVYMDGGKRPPWDTSARAPLLSTEEQNAMWALYEQTVRYVAAQAGRVSAVNIPQVLAMLAGE